MDNLKLSFVNQHRLKFNTLRRLGYKLIMVEENNLPARSENANLTPLVVYFLSMQWNGIAKSISIAYLTKVLNS